MAEQHPMPTLYPWLAATWEKVMDAHRQQRLPHGLLVTGHVGVGKWDFARQLAAALLCETPAAGGQACGTCHQCQLTRAGSQPDLLVVEPEEEGKAVRVDQIRTLCAELALKSHGGGYKVALIRPAERMNVSAANSLLKTLEEPTDNTLLMLITERPAQLTATIRSRCQQLLLPVPPAAEAAGWLLEHSELEEPQARLLLDLVAGAPLEALRLADGDILTDRGGKFTQLEQVRLGKIDPLVCAAEWSKESDMAALLWMQSWISDMIRLTLCDDATGVRNGDLRKRLAQLAQSWTAAGLYEQLDRVTAALRMGASGGVNRQLMIEDILVPWAQPSGTTP